MSAPSPTDIAQRLYSEFGHRFGLEQIVEAVRTAEHDLSGAPPAALPELIERLARQRLTDHLHTTSG